MHAIFIFFTQQNIAGMIARMAHFPLRLVSPAPLTSLADSAALQIRFVLGDAGPPWLGSLSLTVSSGFIRGLTLQQLLGAASPDERPGPRRWRGGHQRLLTALPPGAATAVG